jgi:hypothetical protein
MWRDSLRLPGEVLVIDVIPFLGEAFRFADLAAEVRVVEGVAVASGSHRLMASSTRPGY